MQNLFEIEKALETVRDNATLTKLVKMAKDYDHIFEVLDDEPLKTSDFGPYVHSIRIREPHFEIHTITRLNAKK